MTRDVWFWLRLFNYLLYGGVLTGVVMHFRALRIAGWPLFRWGLWAFIAASAYATAEVMFKGIGGGPRVVLLTIPLLGLFVGCYVGMFRRWRKDRREHG